MQEKKIIKIEDLEQPRTDYKDSAFEETVIFTKNGESFLKLVKEERRVNIYNISNLGFDVIKYLAEQINKLEKDKKSI